MKEKFKMMSTSLLTQPHSLRIPGKGSEILSNSWKNRQEQSNFHGKEEDIRPFRMLKKMDEGYVWKSECRMLMRGMK
jgi:hypothetical protein